MSDLLFEDPNENFSGSVFRGIAANKTILRFYGLGNARYGADAGRAVSFIPKPIITCTAGVDTTRVVVV